MNEEEALEHVKKRLEQLKKHKDGYLEVLAGLLGITKKQLLDCMMESEEATRIAAQAGEIDGYQTCRKCTKVKFIDD